MAPLNRSTQKNRPAKSQRATTLEMVRHACPDTAQALRISESFGLTLIDSDGIRDLHSGQLIESADALKDGPRRKGHADPHAAHRRIVSSAQPTAPGNSTAARSPKPAISPRSFPTIPEMRTSTALLASTAEPSASASSQPIWACRPTCFEWPPKVLSRLTRTSQAKPGSLTSARSSSLPTRSTDKPPLPRCQHSNSRMRGFGPAFSPASGTVPTTWFGKRKKGRRENRGP